MLDRMPESLTREFEPCGFGLPYDREDDYVDEPDQPREFELDADDGLRPPQVPDQTISEVYEEIETNTWLAEQYMRNGALGLAKECASCAFQSWRQFHDILAIYDDRDISQRVVRLAVDLKVPGAHPALIH